MQEHLQELVIGTLLCLLSSHWIGGCCLLISRRWISSWHGHGTYSLIVLLGTILKDMCVLWLVWAKTFQANVSTRHEHYGLITWTRYGHCWQSWTGRCSLWVDLRTDPPLLFNLLPLGIRVCLLTHLINTSWIKRLFCNNYLCIIMNFWLGRWSHSCRLLFLQDSTTNLYSTRLLILHFQKGTYTLFYSNKIHFYATFYLCLL